MLEISGLRGALFGPVDLTIGTGECVAVCGESGSGKSVLLRAIADLDPAQGTVTLNGEPHLQMTGAQWRSQVTLVPAQPGWWADQVADHFEPTHRADAVGLMQALGLSEQAWHWEVDRLSTGEAQRIALVRAMMCQPKVLMLDEPTAALDATAARAVESMIGQLKDAGRAVLLVTHDLDQATRLARRRFTMVAGKLKPSAGGDE